MKKPIATNQIFSPLGHRIGLKYHYADGSCSEVKDGKKVPLRDQETLKKLIKKMEEDR